MRHHKENGYDKPIHEYCAMVDGKPMGIITAAVKAIIATVNPEWNPRFSDFAHEAYGLCGVPMKFALGIDRACTRERLMDPDYNIRIAVQAMRQLLAISMPLTDIEGKRYMHSGGDGYRAVFKAWGLQWGSASERDVKPNLFYFANQTKQPDSYTPNELVGVK